MGKNKTKNKESAEIKVHKLEIEKLEMNEKLKKNKSENTALLISLTLVLFLGAVIFIGSL